jgi:transcriptional regulator with XRE-family HTH domain
MLSAASTVWAGGFMRPSASVPFIARLIFALAARTFHEEDPFWPKTTYPEYNMRGKFVRRSTKNVSHPVKLVREICGFSQAQFGAQLGFSEQHIRNVERGTRVKPMSRDLKDRIFILTGASIDDENSPPWAILEEGNLEPFSAKHYQDHKAMFRDGGFPSRHGKIVLEALKLAFEATEEQSKAGTNHLKCDLFYFGLYKAVSSLIKEYGLQEGLAKHIRRLGESPKWEDKMLARYLCDFTGSRHLRIFTE